MNQTLLRDMGKHLDNQTALLNKIANPPRPDFQDRMELAATGSKMLEILGRRHLHGHGFEPSCEVCQKGNQLMVHLIHFF
jgi:hypothetical protein